MKKIFIESFIILFAFTVLFCIGKMLAVNEIREEVQIKSFNQKTEAAIAKAEGK